MRRRLILSSVVFGLIVLSGCKKDNPAPATTRSYRMGFMNSSPRPDFDDFIEALQVGVKYSDAAIISTEVPWDSLYAGVSVKDYVVNHYAGLVAYYRSLNMQLWVYVDPQNGLNRTSDSYGLVNLKKSIADADVQQLYRRFVLVMDSVIKPEHLGLALETNLIRVAAAPAIYEGVRKAANDAARDVRSIDQSVKLSVSVQADLAWGTLPGSPNTAYAGVDQDFTDFPFIQELGISSYPYFTFTDPADVPDDYYSKLAEGKNIPVFVSEGGWASQSFEGPSGTTISTSDALQAAYITRQGVLLEKAGASALFQLVLTDIDLTTVPSYVDPSIRYFSSLGLLDINLHAKASLTTWDVLFKLPLKQQ